VLGEIDLTTSRWELLYPCSANGQLVKPMNLGIPISGPGALDSTREVLFFNSGDTWAWNPTYGSYVEPPGAQPNSYEFVSENQDRTYYAGMDYPSFFYGEVLFDSFGIPISMAGSANYGDMANLRTYDSNHNVFYEVHNNNDNGFDEYVIYKYDFSGSRSEVLRRPRHFQAVPGGAYMSINNDKLAVDETTGRLFFLDDQCANTWSESSGFTELGCGFSANAVAHYSPGAKRYTIGNGGRATNTWTADRGWEATHSDAGNIAPSGQLISSEQTGRLFFVHGTSMYTWLNGKLDLLVTDSANLGTSSRMLYDEARERFYFADDDNLYSWTKSGGLTTIVSGGTITAEAFKLDEASGQLYFRGTTGNGQGVHWTTGTTSAIIPSSLGQTIRRWAVDPMYSKLYFATPTSLYYWKNDAIATRLIKTFGAENFAAGGMLLVNAKSGRLYFEAGPVGTKDIYYYNPPEFCTANYATSVGASGTSGGSGSGGSCGGGAGPLYCEVQEEI
jgi:hypothetical protein